MLYRCIVFIISVALSAYGWRTVRTAVCGYCKVPVGLSACQYGVFVVQIAEAVSRYVYYIGMTLAM